MASIYEDYFKNYDSQMDESHANSVHDYHIIDFQRMCQEMITSALKEHD